MSEEIVWMPGYELAARIRDRELSPVEVTEAVLTQLEKVEPLLNAFVTVVPELALDEARRAEKTVTSTPADQLPKLHGVPMTVKDLSETAGVRTTYGAVAYKSNVPTHDDIGVGRLRAAGAVLIGKTTTPEHGMLGITESALTGITNNPWALTHTSGGSSGERLPRSQQESPRSPGGRMGAVPSGCPPPAAAWSGSRRRRGAFRSDAVSTWCRWSGP